MNAAELKAKWIEELRSGRYRQGKNRLLTIDGEHCCLGVLGEICAVPRERLVGWGRLSSATCSEVAMDYVIQDRLTKMNDSGQSFPEIADWIETHDLQTGEPL